MTVRFNMPRASAFDINGNPRSGAKLYFYEPTTTTPKDVYSDASLTTPISQPVTASSAGLWASMYMQSSLYRVICKDSSDVTIFDEDNFDPGLAAGFGVSSVVGIAQGGTGAGNAAAARSNLGAASSASLTATQDDVTALEAAVATGVNGDGDFGDLASEDAVSRDLLATSFGTVVAQVVNATPYTTNEALSTGIPGDDTVPTSSEGDQILTAAIAPATTSNKVKITFDGFGCVAGSSTYCIVALFRGTTCIYVNASGANTAKASLSFTYIDSPASTSSQTYSIRVGAPGGNTIRMNGDTSSRLFGGKAACTMRLEELEAH